MVDSTGRNNPGETPKLDAPLDCEQWEALLADKMDGTLAPEAEAAMAEHALQCPGCDELLEQAKQGQEWLKLLEEHAPAAPVDLLSRILAKTQGAGREADFAVGTSGLAGASGAAGLPGGHGRWGIPFLPAANPGLVAGLGAARGAHNARMVMTGAMAFFSVALTLSVAGVRLTSVHAAELRPQVVQANVSRSFYGTKKQVVSFYENLRLVYEVESKMHDLRRDAETTTPALTAPSQSSSAGGKSAAPSKVAPGGGSRTAPKATGGHAAADGVQAPASKSPEQGEQVVHGWPLSVNYTQAWSQAVFKRVSSPVVRCVNFYSKSSAVSSEMLRGALSKERNRT